MMVVVSILGVAGALWCCGNVYVNAVGTEYSCDDDANCGRARVVAVGVAQAW